ncbi:MAG: 2-phosphosulfolactate phosphatase [Acidobacteriia bacterium]|nr:2-phosphosulfolactate phosphatase [Terriglobia bacterium]
MKRTVVIDCFPESVPTYAATHAIVAIDVIRATTTAITCVAAGRRCFPVPSVLAAHRLANRLPNALLAGEVGGIVPLGFHLNNSPAALAARSDIERPLILLSSSGTSLLHKAEGNPATYLGCFRNAAFLVAFLANRHPHIAIIGAGSRGEFREEDQMCCAWIAQGLLRAGYTPANAQTLEIVGRWIHVEPEAIRKGKSAEYLMRSGQGEDLDFVLQHINDLQGAFALRHGEVMLAEESLPSPIATPLSSVQVQPPFRYVET